MVVVGGTYLRVEAEVLMVGAESQKEIRINVYSREATAFMNLLPRVILPFFYRHPRISTV